MIEILGYIIEDIFYMPVILVFSLLAFGYKERIKRRQIVLSAFVLTFFDVIAYITANEAGIATIVYTITFFFCMLLIIKLDYLSSLAVSIITVSLEIPIHLLNYFIFSRIFNVTVNQMIKMTYSAFYDVITIVSLAIVFIILSIIINKYNYTLININKYLSVLRSNKVYKNSTIVFLTATITILVLLIILINIYFAFKFNISEQISYIIYFSFILVSFFSLLYFLLLKKITEYIQYEVENKMQKQLFEKERLASLGQLIGGIAHDLNSRLYVLDGQLYLVNNFANEIINTENLERDDYIEIAKDIVNNIEVMNLSIRSMAKTIDSVRNHTRNYSSENIEVFSMNSIIEVVKPLLNQKFKRNNCTMTYKQNKQDDVYIKGDFSKFENVLINIISNAIESYDKNNETGCRVVEVYTEEKDKETIVSVKDYGKGISLKIKDFIFKEILTTKGVNGTGMGLYFSRSIIVGSFKGDIWFETESGKGTTFYIKIPKDI